MRRLLVLIIGLILATQLSIGVAAASGAYRGRPAGPPKAIDRSSYELGKQVYAGTFVPTANAAHEAEQREVLTDLQERLPVRARGSVDLPSYAGRLSADQVSALRYFLSKRFKVN